MKAIYLHFLLFLSLSFLPVSEALAAVKFSATLDREEASQDESVSLKMVIEVDGGSAAVGDPDYRAPGLEELNSFQNQFFQSYYENGVFGARNTKTVTKVLRATRPGMYSVTGIQVKVDGQIYTAPSLKIKITPPGAGTPPPKNYGGGFGLRGTGKRQTGSPFLLRAEVSKSKAYKGEQIIVSYYIYRKVQMFNPVVKAYPTLNGFLREELEMPVATGGLTPGQQVVVDGSAYVRTLLLRYAAYPLKEGKLTVDALDLTANYYAGQQSGGDDEDDVFNHFFRQLTPQQANLHSAPVTIEVMPLPSEGRTASFTGGVGSFDLVAAVDKYEARVNEPVTLTVKVEGRGNVSAIEAPNTKWPDSIQLYESKGQAKSNTGGVGQKIFEFLLIPTQEGKIVIPALDFSFFDPEKKQYVVKSTQPIEITATPAAPGSQPVGIVPKRGPIQLGQSQVQGQPGALVAEGTSKDIRYLKPDTSENTGFYGQPFWRWTYWLAILAYVSFWAWVGADLIRKTAKSEKRKRSSSGTAWKKLHDQAAAAQKPGTSWKQVARSYEELSNALLDAIDKKVPVGARSLSRVDLHRILVGEKHLDEAVWRRISSLLETAETIQYAGTSGSSEKQAREQLAQWVSEAERIAALL